MNPDQYREKNPAWKGGIIHIRGYKLILKPEHPRAHATGYVYEHILIVEKILGKFLPASAAVHHVNGIKDDNRNENLVVCENRGYHLFLHMRDRAKKACGHAGWKKCQYCGEYDDPKNMAKRGADDVHAHVFCRRKYARKYYHANREHILALQKKYSARELREDLLR